MDLTIGDIILHLSRTKDDASNPSPNRFYALVLNCFQRIADRNTKTMGVRIHDGRLYLHYNPDFLKKLSFHMACFAMKHEVLHILLDHIPRQLALLNAYQGSKDHERIMLFSNKAMDLAINSMLQDDPDWWRVKDEFPWELPEPYGFERQLSYEVYMKKLLEAPQSKQAQQWQAVSPHDWLDGAPPLHDGEAPDGEQKGNKSKKRKKKAKSLDEPIQTPPQTSDELQTALDQVRTQIQHVVKKALGEQKRRGAALGLPQGLEKWLEEYSADPVVPWWYILTSRIQAARCSKPRRSVQQPNRMLIGLAEEDPYIIPSIGTAYDPSYRIIEVIDISTSMSDEMVNIGLIETQALMSTDEDIEVRVMQGTDSIISDHLFKGTDELPRLRAGSGGTDFNPYFEYIWQNYMADNDQAPDLVVIYTDGGTFNDLSPELYLPPEVPVIWLMSPDGYATKLEAARYGEVIWADPAQSRKYDEE